MPTRNLSGYLKFDNWRNWIEFRGEVWARETYLEKSIFNCCFFFFFLKLFNKVTQGAREGKQRRGPRPNPRDTATFTRPVDKKKKVRERRDKNVGEKAENEMSQKTREECDSKGKDTQLDQIMLKMWAILLWQEETIARLQSAGKEMEDKKVVKYR